MKDFILGTSALEVECPLCRAMPGAECTRQPTYPYRFHLARTRAAAKRTRDANAAARAALTSKR